MLGGIVALLAAAVALFQWDWLIPTVEKRASAALGRPVTITHLHVRLGWVPHIEADGVTIGNPENWKGGGNLATADKLGVDIDAMAYIHGRQIVIPGITVDHPQVDAQQLADGTNNWTFPASSNGDAPSTTPGPKIGDLQINDGHAHVVSAKLRADFNVDIATKDAEGDKSGQPGQIVASAKGTYAKQPIVARFTGGALLSLRDDAAPYPVNLQVENGPTKVSLVGTVKDPLAFAGADLKLTFAGPDMSLLLPLTGIAIPKTPAYNIAGNLDYAAGSVRFTHAAGKVGSSDLAGDFDVDTTKPRPVLTADLQSRLVDLKDLGGFIGAEPGDSSKGTKAAAPRNTGRMLPNDPISLPKLNVADVHLKYRAGRIEGRSQPLDNMRADLNIVNGEVKLTPLAFGLGKGQISSTIALAEQGQGVRADVATDFQRIDIGRLLASAGAGQGAGIIGGRAVIQGTGRSFAEILGHGNGELKLYMGSGGNLSALLVDLSGLEFGNAVLSAMGVPNRTKIQCLIADLTMQQGLATVRTMFLDTDEAQTVGKGTLSFYNEALGLQLNTDAKHFSVGTLQAPINITGTFAAPHVRPDVGVVAEKAGAAIALGVLLTPLAALLPTIQLGTGETGACSGALRTAETPPRIQAPAAPRRRTP